MRGIRNLALNGGLSPVVIALLWLLTIDSNMAAEPQAATQSPAPASSTKAASQAAYLSILSEGWHTTPAEASSSNPILSAIRTM